MKMLFCPACNELFNIDKKNIKKCSCGKTVGKYEKNGTITYSYGIPIGFRPQSFKEAIVGQPEGISGERGKEFVAFVIPKKCDSMNKVVLPAPKTKSPAPAEKKKPKPVKEDILADLDTLTI